jgi:hypothetical protein
MRSAIPVCFLRDKGSKSLFLMSAENDMDPGDVGITAAVARPLPSGLEHRRLCQSRTLPGLEYRRLRRSRLLSVPEHDGHCSRLQISLKISGVLGSSVFTRVCIYMGPVTHQVVYDQENQSILCCASITTHIPVISLGYEPG